MRGPCAGDSWPNYYLFLGGGAGGGGGLGACGGGLDPLELPMILPGLGGGGGGGLETFLDIIVYHVFSINSTNSTLLASIRMLSTPSRGT